jgi:FkbM family methyltransferase
MDFSMATKLDDLLRFRIELTASCRDCDALPKVAGAGRIDASAQVQIMHNGIQCVAGEYYGAWMAEIVERLNGHHESQEEVVFHSILAHVPRQATMVELGGFWSYYSLWFLNGAPEARRAIVLEPDPAYLNIGRRNAALNNARGIEFVQASVGLKSVEPRPFQSESSGTVIIPQFSVPDLLAARSMDHLDILHCDAQGAELDVISPC